jgi:GNAT superfamily N-acetyltransferase
VNGRMRIRRAREAEAPFLSQLAQCAKGLWRYASADIERWRPQLTICADDVATKPVFVADVNDVIVGFYMLVPSPRAWELDHLWVLPQFNRRGIGRALLAHASEVARTSGAASIAIDADPHAETFYVACGAIRRSVVSAPIASNPDRVRPQLALNVQTQVA